MRWPVVEDMWFWLSLVRLNDHVGLGALLDALSSKAWHLLWSSFICLSWDSFAADPILYLLFVDKKGEWGLNFVVLELLVQSVHRLLDISLGYWTSGGKVDVGTAMFASSGVDVVGRAGEHVDVTAVGGRASGGAGGYVDADVPAVGGSGGAGGGVDVDATTAAGRAGGGAGGGVDSDITAVGGGGGGAGCGIDVDVTAAGMDGGLVTDSDITAVGGGGGDAGGGIDVDVTTVGMDGGLVPGCGRVCRCEWHRLGKNANHSLEALELVLYPTAAFSALDENVAVCPVQVHDELFQVAVVQPDRRLA